MCLQFVGMFMIDQSVPVRVHLYILPNVNRLETRAAFYRLWFKCIIASTAEELTVTLQGGTKKCVIGRS